MIGRILFPRVTRILGAFALTALCILPLAGTHTVAGAASGADQYQHGITAARAGQYSAAARDFEQALLHGHNDPNTFYQLGLAYGKLKQWNLAAWAIATAMSDPVFDATVPGATKALDAAQKAGGADAGPPPLLRNVTVTPMRAPPSNPAQQAVRESSAAFGALQDPTQAYFVSPEFNKAVTISTAGALGAAAADLNNNSSTSAKFVYLGATPKPYTRLSDYTHDFFSRLGLKRAVLVVVTPHGVAAYSDRLDAAATARISAAQWRTASTQGPVNVAANIARAVVTRADDNDAAATHRSVAIGAVFLVLVLAAVALAVRHVLRPEPGQRAGMARQPRVAVRSRAR